MRLLLWISSFNRNPGGSIGRLNDSRTIKAGIPVSLSGQFAVQGGQALAGLQAWAEDANQAGGISLGTGLKRPVNILHYDDASDTREVRRAVERLITVDRVDLVFGPYSSVLAQSASQVTQRHGKVLWNQGGAADGVYQTGNPWVVGVLTSASQYLEGLLPLVRQKNAAARKVAILRASSGRFPKEVSAGVERVARNLEFEVSIREFEAAFSDFTSEIDWLHRVQPDVVLAVGRVPNDIQLARQLSVRPAKFGVVAVVAAGIQQFGDDLAGLVDGFLGPSQWEETAPYAHDYGPSAEQVMASLSRRSHHTVDYPMAQAYAGGLAAQKCIEIAGTMDDRSLRGAAGSAEFTTFFGRFKIDPETGRQIGRQVVIVQWQQGRKVVVWPPAQAQADLVYPWPGGSAIG